MLKTIERVTKQRIAIEKVPTIADLHARRLELTRAALQESLLEDDLERFRVVVETLTDEFDVMQVALAAVKLAHEATTGGGEEDEGDIPEARAAIERPERGPSRGPGGGASRGKGRGSDGTAGRRRRRGSGSAPGAPRESARRTWSARSRARPG